MAQISQPLNKLISGNSATKKSEKADWDEECEEASWNLNNYAVVHQY